MLGRTAAPGLQVRSTETFPGRDHQRESFVSEHDVGAIWMPWKISAGTGAAKPLSGDLSVAPVLVREREPLAALRDHVVDFMPVTSHGSVFLKPRR